MSPEPISDQIRAFYRVHPEWSALPPEVVEKSFSFQYFVFLEALKGLGNVLAEAITIVLRFGKEDQ